MVLRACCLSGSQSEGSPTGEIVKLESGVDAYIARPTAGQGNGAALLLSTDVFGITYKNMQLVADAYAENGFLVVIPDQFDGKPLPTWIMESFMIIMKPGTGYLNKAMHIVPVAYKVAPWMFWNPPAKKFPILEAAIKEIRAGKLGGPISKVGMQGFCYGGKACLAFAKRDDLVDAFSVVHGEVKVPEDIEPLKKPGLFITADGDPAFPKAKHDAAEELLKSRGDGDKYRFAYYPGTFHGFMIRGSDDDPVVKAAKEEAFKEGVAFFKKTLL